MAYRKAAKRAMRDRVKDLLEQDTINRGSLVHAPADIAARELQLQAIYAKLDAAPDTLEDQARVVDEEDSFLPIPAASKNFSQIITVEETDPNLVENDVYSIIKNRIRFIRTYPNKPKPPISL